MNLDIKCVKKDFYHSSKLGWYFIAQLNMKGEDFFMCQQLPPKVTSGWERWFPVTEKLPDDSVKRILVIDNENGIAPRLIKAKSLMQKESWGVPIGIFAHGVKVTHWLPVPDAPKEDE